MLDEERRSDQLAVTIVHGGRIALALGGRRRWQEYSGYTLMPAELPGGGVERPNNPENDALRICATSICADVTLRPSRHVYGPSPDHAIDLLPAADEREPLPLLRLPRMLALDRHERTPAVVTLRVYLGTIQGGGGPAGGVPGLLWLSPRALRVALRGVPLSDLLARDDAELQLRGDELLPDAAFVYVPADYGERHLVRIAAKYGPGAIFE